MSTLLLEIGCEELPAKVCVSIHRQLVGAEDGGAEGLVRRLLAEHRLLPDDFGDEGLRVLVSPRRVAVLAPGVPERQTARVQRFRGPRADVAFGADGSPTKAGLGFAKSRGVAPEALQRAVIDGSEFAVAEVEAERMPASEVVPAFAADLLRSIQVPRGMRWGVKPAAAEDYLRFSRPIRWLVCKLGAETLRFPFYDMEAGDLSLGHRFLGAPAEITTAEQYVELLAAQKVVVDQKRRRETIVRGLEDQAAVLGGVWFDPGDVLAEAVYLVEWPSVQHGVFDRGKLRLPAELLITAMQSHQRYFPVRDADGRLLPVFLFVSNADPTFAPVITAGNERVLEGRLDDAGFAYDRDVAEGLLDMARRLGSVVFQEKLGTLADKAARMERLAVWLAGATDTGLAGGDAALAAPDRGSLADTLRRAAQLAKADLVSQVVIEFPVQQGTMGGIYALAAGLPQAVAAAIAEQYLPLSTTAPLPASLAGGLLAIADKIDNIAGAWIAGEKPSGSRDPYGLRRAAMGIVRIALEYDLRVPLRRVVDMAVGGYKAQGRLVAAASGAAPEVQIEAFVLERLEGLLLDEGLPFDLVEAALGSDAADIPALAARARAFAVLGGRDAFVAVVTAHNRCASLAAKEAAGEAVSVAPALFTLDAERALYEAVAEAAAPVSGALEQLDIESALAAAARLRPVVDRYFDEVLVMDQDPAVRANRLAQLVAVSGLLRHIGEFSRLAV